MSADPARAIVVEDDHSWQQILSEILVDCGLVVDTAGTLADAIQGLKLHSHRLAVVDLSLDEGDPHNLDGLHVLEEVRRLDPGCRAILLTGFATVELAVRALTTYGAFTFLRKENFRRSEFCDWIQRALAAAVPIMSESSAVVDEVSSGSPIPIVVREVPYGLALVVEDDAGWRSILAELLGDAGYNVQLCNSFGEALGHLRRDKYDLAIMDLSLTGTAPAWGEVGLAEANLEGYQLLASTKTGGIPTIVVSGVASPEEIRRAYAEQDIFAYLEKQTFDRSAFLRTVEQARLARQVPDELDVLTVREREVLDLLAEGKTNKEIAEALVITINTVKRHLKAIFSKLEVHTRSAAVAKTTK